MSESDNGQTLYKQKQTKDPESKESENNNDKSQ